MKVRYLLTFLIALLVINFTIAQEDSTIAPIDSSNLVDEVTETPTISLENYEVGYENGELIINAGKIEGETAFTINGDETTLTFEGGVAKQSLNIGDGKLLLLKKGRTYSDHKLVHISPQKENYRIKAIPLWLSILPPLVAIALALIFKEVIISLFVGIWAGAIVANGLQFNPIKIINSFFEVVSKYIVNTLGDSGHLSVMLFSLMIGGMVAVISRNGGMAGVVERLSKYAKDAKSTQLVTWFMGLAIFFDDYANTLIVGNTMRPVSDRFKISREKLAYIVDSTAAPVAAIAFITTWIGVELSYIKNNMTNLENLDVVPSAYAVFLSSLQYSFYPILTLAFILILIFTRKDFGAMLKAEKRARAGKVANKRGNAVEESDMEDLAPVEGAVLKWYNAAIPVFVVILVTIIGLIDTGTAASYSALVDGGHAVASKGWSDVWSQLHLLSDAEGIGFFERLGILIGNADSYVALLWSSLSGVCFAIMLTLGGKIMNITDTMNTVATGFKAMLPALMILASAWALGDITGELNTATFLTSTLQDALNPYLMPAVIFVLAGAIAFSTGSSWSTMAILYPIAIPATWAICQANGIPVDTSLAILYNVIATVLAASVFGDHCSPISDTTILSSLATDCNHIDHVRTQLPYALTVGTVSLILGVLSTALGTPALLNFAVGIVFLYLFVQYRGKVAED